MRKEGLKLSRRDGLNPVGSRVGIDALRKEGLKLGLVARQLDLITEQVGIDALRKEGLKLLMLTSIVRYTMPEWESTP